MPTGSVDRLTSPQPGVIEVAWSVYNPRGSGKVLGRTVRLTLDGEEVVDRVVSMNEDVKYDFTNTIEAVTPGTHEVCVRV